MSYIATLESYPAGVGVAEGVEAGVTTGVSVGGAVGVEATIGAAVGVSIATVGTAVGDSFARGDGESGESTGSTPPQARQRITAVTENMGARIRGMRSQPAGYSPALIQSEMRSANIMIGTLVLDLGQSGRIEPSTNRNPSTPLTRPC